mgnify:CR=1 FL=1
MPNNYTNVLYVFDGADREYPGPSLLQQLVFTGWGARPLNRAIPMPADLEGTASPVPAAVGLSERMRLLSAYGADNWYDWQHNNRGVKWDAYNVQLPVELPGDASVVQLVFCTAWAAPNETTCTAVARELLTTYGAERVVWHGIEPYDDSFNLVGAWERSSLPVPALALVTP